jgi:TonB family protein
MTARIAVLVFVVAASMAVAAQTEPTLASANIPKYPPLASQARVEGVVTLSFALPANGAAPTNVEVESGHPLLKTAAEENVKAWRFENPCAIERKYETVFQYRLSAGEGAGKRSVTVTFKSFHHVEIVTDVPQVPINY